MRCVVLGVLCALSERSERAVRKRLNRKVAKDAKTIKIKFHHEDTKNTKKCRCFHHRGTEGTEKNMTVLAFGQKKLLCVVLGVLCALSERSERAVKTDVPRENEHNYLIS